MKKNAATNQKKDSPPQKQYHSKFKKYQPNTTRFSQQNTKTIFKFMQNNPKLFSNTCKNSQTDEIDQSLVVNKNNFQKTFDKRSQNCVINYSYQVERAQFR